MVERRYKYFYCLLGSFFAAPLLVWFGFDVLRWSPAEVWWLAAIGTVLIALVFGELDFRLNRDYYLGTEEDAKSQDEDRI